MSHELDQFSLRERHLTEAAEWLLRLREDSLSESDIAAWRAWCHQSPENARAFADVLQIWEVAGDALRPATAVPATENYRHHLTKTPARDWHRSRVWLKRVSAGWSAAVAAGIAAVALLLSSVDTSSPPPQQLSIAPPQGLNRSVTLPDQSAVTVRGGTRLTADFNARERRVILNGGEAFFQVSKDKQRPFVVHALDTRITAVGTAFNVEANRDVVRVTVTEGVVEVARPHSAADGSGQEIIHLSAGRGLVWQAGQTAPVIALLDKANATSWVTGTLEFSNEPLASVVEALNRYGSRHVNLDASLRGHQFTGTVTLENIDEWLAALPTIFPVMIQHSDGADSIQPRPQEESTTAAP